MQSVCFAFVAVSLAVAAVGACSNDLPYDPEAVADPVEACMVMEHALCERVRECNDESAGCDIEWHRLTCERQVVELPCGETAANAFLGCADYYSGLDCDGPPVILLCSNFCDR